VYGDNDGELSLLGDGDDVVLIDESNLSLADAVVAVANNNDEVSSSESLSLLVDCFEFSFALLVLFELVKQLVLISSSEIFCFSESCASNSD